MVVSRDHAPIWGQAGCGLTRPNAPTSRAFKHRRLAKRRTDTFAQFIGRLKCPIPVLRLLTLAPCVIREVQVGPNHEHEVTEDIGTEEIGRPESSIREWLADQRAEPFVI